MASGTPEEVIKNQILIQEIYCVYIGEIKTKKVEKVVKYMQKCLSILSEVYYTKVCG